MFKIAEDNESEEEVFLSSKIVHSQNTLRLTPNTDKPQTRAMEPLEESEHEQLNPENYEPWKTRTNHYVESRHLSLESQEESTPLKNARKMLNSSKSTVPTGSPMMSSKNLLNSRSSPLLPRSKSTRSNSNRSKESNSNPNFRWIRTVSHSSRKILRKIDSSLNQSPNAKNEDKFLGFDEEYDEMDQSMSVLDTEKKLEKEKLIKKERKLMITSIVCVMFMTFVIWYVSITGMLFGAEYIGITTQNVNETGVFGVISCDHRFLITESERFVPVKVLGEVGFLKYDDFKANIGKWEIKCFIKVLK